MMVIIMGRLKRRKGRICRIHGYGTVENIPLMNRRTGVLVAKSLLCTSSTEISLSVVNLGVEPVTFDKVQMVALLQLVQSVVEMKVEEQEASGMEVGDGKEVHKHLWKMYERTCQHLDWGQRQKVKDIILRYLCFTGCASG